MGSGPGWDARKEGLHSGGHGGVLLSHTDKWNLKRLIFICCIMHLFTKLRVKISTVICSASSQILNVLMGDR